MLWKRWVEIFPELEDVIIKLIIFEKNRNKIISPKSIIDIWQVYINIPQVIYVPQANQQDEKKKSLEQNLKKKLQMNECKISLSMSKISPIADLKN